MLWRGDWPSSRRRWRPHRPDWCYGQPELAIKLPPPKRKPHYDEAERTQPDHKITEVVKGQTTGHVHIDICGGVTVHASITNEAIDDLAIKVGDEAWAVIKASDVMIGK